MKTLRPTSVLIIRFLILSACIGGVVAILPLPFATALDSSTMTPFYKALPGLYGR